MSGQLLSFADPALAIAEKVGRGECILFLGAGVHHPPPPESSEYNYPESDRPPLGETLSHGLADECDFSKIFPSESSRNLQRVALCYERRKSRTELVRRISFELNGKKPSAVVRALASLPFALIITTNYDTLFEQALRAASKQPQIGVYTPDRNRPTEDYDRHSASEPFVFKIHGDVGRPESLVVTDEDYIQFVMRMSDRDRFHPVPETFLFYLKKWPTLFVGYSLLDYNLRLLFMSMRWKIDRVFPDAYSVDKQPDPLILDVWWNERRYVRFIADDVWSFVPNLYQRITGNRMPA